VWVVFNSATGYEIDRVETREERDEMITDLESLDIWGYSYSYRWEN